MNQLNKNPNLAELETSYQLCSSLREEANSNFHPPAHRFPLALVLPHRVRQLQLQGVSFFEQLQEGIHITLDTLLTAGCHTCLCRVGLTLIWVFHHLAQLPSRFCQIPICPGRIGQTVTHSNSSQPNPVHEQMECTLTLAD